MAHKPYLLPRICVNVKQLEGLYLVVSQYLNMGHYTIELSPHNQYMKIIITKFGKLKYNIS